MTTLQSGDTMVISTEEHEMRLQRKNGVRAEMVLPGLREVWSEGVGKTDISGFSGKELELLAGRRRQHEGVVDYRMLRASLGGVGRMQLWASENEPPRLDLGGAGYMTLWRHSKLLRASWAGWAASTRDQFQAEAVS